MLNLNVSQSQLNNLEALLLNSSGNIPLHRRFRALFTLKALKNEEAVRIISKGFQDPSALLKHELAYCLGQMKTTVQGLTRSYAQAAEAMGAISSTSSVPVLKKYLKIQIAQTYTSVDPAPPISGLLAVKVKPGTVAESSVEDLRSKLLETQLPLFERYRAMFALRNIGTPEAVDALAEGFSDDSALFKHEIAFVFGQLLSPHAVPSLLQVLQNSQESDMEYLTREDAPVVVKESCQVALDMYEYENSDHFQYADGLDATQLAESASA
ncbi:hypothetical protein B0F90DRAFT_1815797 [Multifurca ochricompacta]|uniref:Deoxyhypusine hydroxylase n=1 Tax=Multifurca ochricompacta TaxID=376703 RepID=A0AAD4QNX7_9AGAM|nr:hypothetical protein B0F90DRAFT_1815797 [Multifurca ochricompacta]